MPPADAETITLSEAAAAIKAGAKLRMALCIQGAAGKLISYLRFTGVKGWLKLVDRKHKAPRIWASLDRFLKRMTDTVGEVACCVVCPEGHPCLAKMGVRL